MKHSQPSVSQQDRLKRALVVLEGLSVGDAIGEALSYQHYRCREIADFSAFRPGSVRYTDDTEMATALVDTLERLGSIDEVVLAWAFASRYKKDPQRGYGRMARRVLEEVGCGTPWEQASQNAFGGGSFGNGGAMRVGPLGAFFAEDLETTAQLAAKSARVTHYHPEGIAGAVAVAVAAATSTAHHNQPASEAAQAIWDSVITYTPESRVRMGLQRARSLFDANPRTVANEVGNGAEISAQDTVPFCIWSACSAIDNYREAILQTIEVGGDVDTNCAIVGGIVSAFGGTQSIPQDWLQAREPLKRMH